MRIILIWGLYHIFDQMSRVLFAFFAAEYRRIYLTIRVQPPILAM